MPHESLTQYIGIWVFRQGELASLWGKLGGAVSGDETAKEEHEQWGRRGKAVGVRVEVWINFTECMSVCVYKGRKRPDQARALVFIP